MLEQTQLMLEQTHMMSQQVADVYASRVSEIENNRIVELARIDQAKHLDDLNATLQVEEARFRSQERIAAYQTQLVQYPGPIAPLAGIPQQWAQSEYDPDPTHLGPDPFGRDGVEQQAQYPTFNEQEAQQYQPQYQEREQAVMVPPGASLIPGAENEATIVR